MQTISSVRDARIGIPHRTDEPLGQVFEPGIRPRGSENSLRQTRYAPPGVSELRLCRYIPLQFRTLLKVNFTPRLLFCQ
ncbi:hypothetical protein ACVWWD_002258 [Mesorhizobium sp. URHB0026]|nr:hypothetical protein X739_18135 [Mesorhizobium sp. LNHC220B00]